MPPKPQDQKSVLDLLGQAANAIAEAMTSEDANDPQVQGVLGQLQQALVQTVHALRQAKAQQAAGTQQQQAAQSAGTQMSAGPGQPGYGSGSPAQAGMVADMTGGGGGGGGGGAGGINSPDDYSRMLGTVGKGQTQ